MKYRRNIVRKSIVAEKKSEKITTQRSANIVLSSAEVILGIIFEILGEFELFSEISAYLENICKQD